MRATPPIGATLSEEYTRRKTDKYARPNDDHDLLTQLWTMFLHSCDEQRERHSDNTRRVEELRKEQAEARSAVNYRIDSLVKDVETKFGVLSQDIENLRSSRERQIGAWLTLRLTASVILATFIAAGAGAAVAAFLSRLPLPH